MLYGWVARKLMGLGMLVDLFVLGDVQFALSLHVHVRLLPVLVVGLKDNRNIKALDRRALLETNFYFCSERRAR